MLKIVQIGHGKVKAQTPNHMVFLCIFSSNRGLRNLGKRVQKTT